MIYLDTHVVAWLFAGRTDLFPRTARRRLGATEIRISPAVMLELQYLYEIQRVASPGSEVVTALATELGLVLCDLPFGAVARSALDHGWTRDPFDRLIVGHAACDEAPLLTKDRSIHEHYPRAEWDS